MLNFDFDAAIFDMDGTILDSMMFWRYGATVEFLLHHYLPVDAETLMKLKYTSSRKIAVEALQKAGDDFPLSEIVPEMEGYMDVHYQRDVRPKACVGEFLELVRGEGIRMCVATAVPRDIASRALEKHGLLKYFEFVTDVYETPCKKNDPRYFQYLSDRLGVRTERCCMFEDALYSIRCAKAAGMQVWAVEDGCAIADRGDIMNLADRYIKGYDLLLGRGNEEEGINYRNL